MDMREVLRIEKQEAEKETWSTIGCKSKLVNNKKKTRLVIRLNGRRIPLNSEKNTVFISARHWITALALCSTAARIASVVLENEGGRGEG